MVIRTTLIVTLFSITANAQDTIPHVDSMKTRSLNETVVIGYGTVKKRDLTGAVFSVKPDVIMLSPTQNALESLQGRVPGMDVTRNSGKPGDKINVLVRGNRSISGSNDPLYIIDGVQGGNISNLNPADIASVEVLKDASSTAIYGAQGANGVVIVTTKKGTAGKTRVSYTGYYGVNGMAEYPQPRIGEDYLKLRREAYRTTLAPGDPLPDDATIFTNNNEYEAIKAGQWVNWVDLLKHNATQQQHSISVAGGTEKTKFYFSGGYFREEGILKNNNATRYTVRLSVDHNMNRWLKLGLQSQFAYNKINDRQDPFSNAISTSPLGLAFDDNGRVNRFPIAGNTSTISPMADERNQYIFKDETIGSTTLLNAYAEVKLIDGLTFRSNLGTSIGFERQGVYQDATSLARKEQLTPYSAIESSNNRFYNWDNILTYNRSFGDHAITVTALSSYTHRDYDDLTGGGYSQAVPGQLFYNLNTTDAVSRITLSSYVGSKTMSYAARINYNYKGKYMLTISERVDGASRLAPGHKWADFPSIAAGWRIIDAVKVRASYGVAGNSGITEYGTQTTLKPSTNMSFGNVAAPMYTFNDLVGNTQLGWELSATTNIGVDLDLFRGRLNATIDAYNTRTTDLLQKRTLPQSTGVVEVYQNIGETNNRGIEIVLNSINVDRKDFKWNSAFTFTANRERIISLIDNKNVTTNEKESLVIGHPVKSFYSFRKLGIWQTDEAAKSGTYSFGGTPFKPGDIKLEDRDGDMKITSDGDRMYLGSQVPKWSAGIQNTFTYKAFDLGFFVFARWGQMIYAELLGRYNPSGEGNGPAFFDYWTPENPTNDFPRPIRGGQLNKYPGANSLNFVDGSYVKLKNVTLGYTLPARVAERMDIQRLRIYATGSNIFTKARSHLVRYYDPERGGSESIPLTRQFVFGLNVDF